MTSKLSLNAIFTSLKQGHWLSADLCPQKVGASKLEKTRILAKKLIGIGENYSLRAVSNAILDELQAQLPQSPQDIANARAILSCIEKKTGSDYRLHRIFEPQIASIRQLLSRQINR